MRLGTLIRTSIRDAVDLYFQPINTLWRRTVANYSDRAARDFLMETQSMVALVSALDTPIDLLMDVAYFLREADEVLTSEVSRVANLPGFAKLILLQSDVWMPDAKREIEVHAAFVSGYFVGLVEDSLPSRHVLSMRKLHKIHGDVVAIVRGLRKRLGGSMAA